MEKTFLMKKISIGTKNISVLALLITLIVIIIMIVVPSSIKKTNAKAELTKVVENVFNNYEYGEYSEDEYSLDSYSFEIKNFKKGMWRGKVPHLIIRCKVNSKGIDSEQSARNSCITDLLNNLPESYYSEAYHCKMYIHGHNGVTWDNSKNSGLDVYVNDAYLVRNGDRFSGDSSKKISEWGICTHCNGKGTVGNGIKCGFCDGYGYWTN